MPACEGMTGKTPRLLKYLRYKNFVSYNSYLVNNNPAAWERLCQVEIMEMSASEPFDEA
jgi:hypothetical protein